MDEAVIEGGPPASRLRRAGSVKIFATIPLPNKIHEREINPTSSKLRRAGKTGIPGTFNAGATLGPINQTKIERIWTKHKQSFDMTQDKLNTTLKPKVFVAMSGGVDSSVSAALLKQQGYRVAGFFMKNWSDAHGLKKTQCPWLVDREDAMRVAAMLDIEFHTLDFEEEYKKQVLDYFFIEYEKGRTPNPDVFCNSTIKFGVFLDKAVALGAEKIATGHYAQLHQRNNMRQLKKAADANKDQTYFLYRLNQNQLSYAMFPIGGLTKPEVRAMAKKLGLPNHDKPDSQGVCFIGHIDLRAFLSQKIKELPGDIKAVDGSVIGRHTGLFWYTIGQRKGINIGGRGPYYVVEKDFGTNTLVVSNNKEAERLYTIAISFADAHWIAGEEPALPLACEGRIRYREPLCGCVVEKNHDGTLTARFKKAQWACASGQSIVLYQGEVCIGGGIII